MTQSNIALVAFLLALIAIQCLCEVSIEYAWPLAMSSIALLGISGYFFFRKFGLAVACFILIAFTLEIIVLEKRELRIHRERGNAIFLNGGRIHNSRYSLLEFRGVIQRLKRRTMDGATHYELTGSILGFSDLSILLMTSSAPWNQSSFLTPGSQISGTALVRFPSLDEKSHIPWSYPRYLIRNGVSATARLVELQEVYAPPNARRWRDELYIRLVDGIGESEALAVLFAVTLGMEDLVGERIRDLFQETGVSHILSISGFHVGVVFAAVYLICRSLLLLFRPVFPCIPEPLVAAPLALVVAGIYGLTTGAGVPIVRAAIVLSVCAGARALDRDLFNSRNLLLSVVLVLYFWPGCFFEPSFQLTFSAVSGLFLGSACVSSRKGFIGKLIQGAAVSFGAFLCSAPIVLLWFHGISTVAILANITIVPVLSFLGICLGLISLEIFVMELPGAIRLIEMNTWLLHQILNLLSSLRDFVVDTPLTYQQLSSGQAELLAFGFLLLDLTLFGLVFKKRNARRKRLELLKHIGYIPAAQKSL